jgi:hypothetical protein
MIVVTEIISNVNLSFQQGVYPVEITVAELTEAVKIELTEINESVNIEVTEVNETLVVNLTEVNESVNIEVAETFETVNIEVAEMGVRGLQGVQGIQGGIIYKTAGEPLNSHTPIAIFDGLAYKLDASNDLHKFAFVGFSRTSALIGGNVEVIQIGEISLLGWGLVANAHYLAGTAGTLVLSNDSEFNFTKIIGYAVNENTLQIIKDSVTINKF